MDVGALSLKSDLLENELCNVKVINNNSNTIVRVLADAGRLGLINEKCL